MKKLVAAGMLMMAPFIASAYDFFDTSRPDNLFTIGVRTGVNTSVRTVKKDVFNFWNNDSWGTGFDLGAVADINIRNFISLQPGFFYESRSGKHAYSNIYMTENSEVATMNQFGNYRSYNFNIPVVASVHLNISDDVRWNLDFGPYINMRLGTSGTSKIMTQLQYTESTESSYYDSRWFDFGFKMGSGLTVKKHYYLGVHYLAGTKRVWKDESLGGRNKAWTFTVGYDL